MKKKLILLQMQLDTKKYFESQLANRDLSGQMDYCEKCNNKVGGCCGANQEERVKNCLCAMAYNNK